MFEKPSGKPGGFFVLQVCSVFGSDVMRRRKKRLENSIETAMSDDFNGRECVNI
jgi:hypothetical protein